MKEILEFRAPFAKLVKAVRPELTGNTFLFSQFFSLLAIYYPHIDFGEDLHELKLKISLMAYSFVLLCGGKKDAGSRVAKLVASLEEDQNIVSVLLSTAIFTLQSCSGKIMKLPEEDIKKLLAAAQPSASCLCFFRQAR